MREPTPFGVAVRRWREARGYSQSELAAIVGMDENTIWGIESGERGKNPRRLTINALATALRIPPAELLETLGRPVTDDDRRIPPGPEERDTYIARFTSAVRNDPLLSKRGQDRVLRLYRDLIDERPR